VERIEARDDLTSSPGRVATEFHGSVPPLWSVAGAGAFTQLRKSLRRADESTSGMNVAGVCKRVTPTAYRLSIR
jgi:hypothetical protein